VDEDEGREDGDDTEEVIAAHRFSGTVGMARRLRVRAFFHFGAQFCCRKQFSKAFKLGRSNANASRVVLISRPLL